MYEIRNSWWPYPEPIMGGCFLWHHKWLFLDLNSVPVGYKRRALTFTPHLLPIMFVLIEVNLKLVTRSVTLDHYILPAMNSHSVIQIDGPEKSYCGTRAEAIIVLMQVLQCHQWSKLSSNRVWLMGPITGFVDMHP